MLLGIRPTVDFAFKMIFGLPQNSAALIGLLNAILDLKQPIVAVEVLNPFSYQEFAESKLIVLDVRCRDDAGRWLNVEMQVSVYAGLIERLVYYACSMYVDQLSPGSNYALASPSISICLLDRVLFAKSEQPHHRFQMIDRKSGKELSNAIEVHTVEFPRSKSFPPKRRTNKCMTNAKKPNETTNGPSPAPVKKDEKKDGRWDEKRDESWDVKRDLSAESLPVGSRRCKKSSEMHLRRRLP
ncbi:PD-(D/E)XK nuclease family transposase [Neorhodopirellula pilleata]|uniref:PD-(D/E)XK nuclease family transposase n=2 Tax=Neorhodopirellula pilleata TaxID=2714738 RepID=A0A5C5ZPZ2_9BACT|nr:PD-(D/E)XK nuclease family transposase [Neorhodopirellula pilleata]